MKYKLYLKAISVVLVVALLLQCVPLSVSAHTEQKVEQVEENFAYVLGEDMSKREAAVKHFRMSDGSYTAVTYADDVHYLDDSGKFVDIDNTLVLSKDGTAYKNKSNPFDVTLPKLSSGKVSIKYKDEEISFKLLEAKTVDKQICEYSQIQEKLTADILTAKTEKEKIEAENNQHFTLDKYTSSISYNKVYDNTDVNYNIDGKTLKESIIIHKNPQKSYKYEFYYTGYSAILNEDNSVSFKKGDATVFEIQSPYMFDAKGATSVDIDVSVTETKNGCIYEIIPDSSWLSHKERVYPVVIDPTIIPQLSARNIKDATVVFTQYSQYVESYVSDSVDLNGDNIVTPYYWLKVGNWGFSNLDDEMAITVYSALPSEIPKTARIISAQIGLALDRFYTNQTLSTVRIDAFKITSDWNTNVFIDKILFTDTTPCIPSINSSVIDFNYITSDSDLRYYYFDITRAAQSWLQNEDNYGIMLRMNEYDWQEGNVVYFRSSDFIGIDANGNTFKNVPVFVYQYRDTAGLEEYWSYHDVTVGDAGTGYVNDFNGNLTFVRSDTAFSNERYNVAVAHIYNSNASSVSSPYGNGWRINLMQQTGSETVGDTSYYYYIDTDGTKHYFYNDDGVYKDEDGLGYVYNSGVNGYTAKITTKDDTELCFGSNGYLAKIIDANDNAVEFVYSDSKITAVRIDGTNVITFSYSGGKLNSVTNHKTSRTTNYGYDSSGDLISVTESWVTGHINSYSYSGKLLTAVTDSTGYRINYSFVNPVTNSVSDSIHRVYCVTESALNENGQRVDGQTLRFGYNTGNQTVIEDCGLDGDITTTADNNKMTYQFDIFGRVVSGYDDEGRGSTFKYDERENKHNQLTLSAASYEYIPGGEILKETSFDYYGAFWSCYNGTYEDIYNSINNAPYGIALSNGRAVYQQIKLNKGTYVVSAEFEDLSNGATGEIRVKYGSDSDFSSTYTSSAYIKLGDVSSYGFGIYHHTLEFTVNEDNTDVLVGFGFVIGSMAIDNIDIYKKPYTNKSNYLFEGDFSSYNKAAYESFRTWNYDHSAGMASVVNNQLHITGFPMFENNPLYVEQESIYGFDEGEVLLLSGWAKAESCFSDYSTFRLAATFEFLGGETKNVYLDFNKNITDWQFASMPIIIDDGDDTADRICSVTVKVEYTYQINDAYFDNIQLIKDDATSYVYDDEGNVISVKSAASQSEFQYDGNSRLTLAVDNTGRNFNYTYDENNNLTSAVSDAATVITYKYNDYGQAVFSSVYGSEYSVPLSDNAVCYISLRSNGYYMEYYYDKWDDTEYEYYLINNPFIGISNSRFQKAILNKQSDGYYTIKINKKYLTANADTENSVIVLSDDASSDFTHFKLVRNKDGGFHIVPKVNTELCLTNSTNDSGYSAFITLTTINENADNQVWYLETTDETEETLVINDKKIFNLRNANSGKYLTVANLSQDQQIIVGNKDDNELKLYLEKYGDTQYYYVRIVDNDLVLCYNETNRKITLQPKDETNEYQLFDVKAVEYNPAAARMWHCEIHPKTDSTVRLVEFDGVSMQNLLSMRSCWYFEEVFYSSSTADYTDNGYTLNSTTDNATGLTTSYTYDSIGRVTATTVGDRTTSTTYDNRDRTTGVSQGNSSIGYTYENNLLKTINVDGAFSYNFEYDAFGNNTGIKVGNTPLARYSYINNTGLMLSTVYGNNDSVDYTYDNDYRVTKKTYTDKNSQGSVLSTKNVNFEYDLFGNVHKVTDGFTGLTTEYKYDLIGRPKSVYKQFNGLKNYTYDEENRISQYTTNLYKFTTFINTSVNYSYNGQVSDITNTISGVENKISYEYDALLRIKNRRLEAINKTSNYTYLNGEKGQATMLVGSLNNGADSYSYTYDDYGNVTSVSKNGSVIESYEYDGLNQLTQAAYGGNVYTYTYDDRGNIQTVKRDGTTIKSYTYGNSNWKDLLTSYNGRQLTYDSIGNPDNWRTGFDFTWSYGRRLTGITKDGNSISYTYDGDGLRTSKTVNGTTTEYLWLDGILQGQKTGSEHIIFLYDENGTAYGMLVDNGTTEDYYYYLFNLQGDVVGIMNSQGEKIVEYTYSPWGELLSTTGTLADTIGQKNPLRYRGYYYDTETGFYYCNSRYYDSVVGRWINADGYVSTGQDMLGFNMFAYCGNNPVNLCDCSGTCPHNGNLVEIYNAECIVCNTFLFQESINKHKSVLDYRFVSPPKDDYNTEILTHTSNLNPNFDVIIEAPVTFYQNKIVNVGEVRIDVIPSKQQEFVKKSSNYVKPLKILSSFDYAIVKSDVYAIVNGNDVYATGTYTIRGFYEYRGIYIIRFDLPEYNVLYRLE